MSNLPVFSINPGSAPHLQPVTLTMSPGYTATASIADVCGRPIPGASVTTAQLVATPHLPAAYQGTFFVDWRITHAGQPHGLGIALTLASRQQQGHPSTCPATAASKPHAAQQPRAGSLTVLPGHGSFPAVPVAAGGSLLLALAIAGTVVLRARRRRPRGTHHKETTS